MGEVEATWVSGRDLQLLDYISSINISCGYHAGNEQLIKQTLRTSVEKGLKIGIHPGFDDPKNFGRTSHPIDSAGLKRLLEVQITSFLKWAKEYDAHIHHIKLHGALYNLVSSDKSLSEVYCDMIKGTNAEWIVYCPPASETYKMAQDKGMVAWSEAFADRVYLQNGKLTPRSEPYAVIKDKKTALRQVKSIVEEKKVYAHGGHSIPMDAQTLCIHGDTDEALLIAQEIHNYLINR